MASNRLAKFAEKSERLATAIDRTSFHSNGSKASASSAASEASKAVSGKELARLERRAFRQRGSRNSTETALHDSCRDEREQGTLWRRTKGKRRND